LSLVLAEVTIWALQTRPIVRTDAPRDPS
jgi:hypothetical protein